MPVLYGGFSGACSGPMTAAVADFSSAAWPEFAPPYTNHNVYIFGKNTPNIICYCCYLLRNYILSQTGFTETADDLVRADGRVEGRHVHNYISLPGRCSCD